MRPCTRRIAPAEPVIKATSLDDGLVRRAPWCRTAPAALLTHIKPLVDDLDAERDREERRVLEHVVPGHPGAAQCLDAAKAREVAAAKLHPLEPGAAECRLPELATLEEHVGESGVVEVALGHPAVAEDDALEPRHPEPDEVEPAVGEGDVGERRLGQLRAGQPAAAHLDAQRGEPPRTEIRPFAIEGDGVDEVAELDDGLGVLVGIRRIRHGRRLSHAIGE